MNSLNKHVPTIVFIFGLGLLLVSIRTFFNPAPDTSLTPMAIPGAPSTTAGGPRTRPVVIFKPTKPNPTVERSDPREALVRTQEKIAYDYLDRVGLKLNLPAGYLFAQETDGPVQVLVGSSEAGRRDFFMFSTEGKYPVNRVIKFIKDYFADENGMIAKGKIGSVFTRSSFREMTLIRGSNKKGLDFQAYYFSDGKQNRSHMIVFANRLMNKQPARVREVIDSVRRGG
ncbi:MAG: hypothetical protein AB7F86_16945 [Bdellovibrionales bacterium]